MPSRARCVGLLVGGGRAHSLVVSSFSPDKVPPMAAFSTPSDEAGFVALLVSPPFCSGKSTGEVNRKGFFFSFQQFRSFRVAVEQQRCSSSAGSRSTFNIEIASRGPAVLSRYRTRPER